MKKLHSFSSKLKTISYVTCVTFVTLVVALVATATASAWGPERPTYTNASPAPYATFNSITDNVAVGDERNFVRVGEVGSTAAYTDELEVVPGHEYEVYIYYHNDAASNTNSTGYGVATNVRVSSAYPTTLHAGERGMVSGIISYNYVDLSDATHDANVWDEAYFTTQVDGTVLRYKTGTAVIHNGGQANGTVLPTTLFTEAGTPIGFNKLSGVIPGCAEYSGYITYTLVAESTTAEVTKEISTDGENWNNSATVNPGDFVTYHVNFKNTGNTTLTNVIFKDIHSEDLVLRSGSTRIYDVNHTSGLVIDDILDLSGYNVGDVAPGALVQIIYQARIAEGIEDCTRTLANRIEVEYNGATQLESSTMVSLTCSGNNVEENDDIHEDACALDSTLPGCSSNNPISPDDPGLPSEIVNTGPLEIILAILIILGIGGGIFYYVRTHRAVRVVTDRVSGEPSSRKGTKNAKNAQDSQSTADSAQKPSNDSAK